MLQLAVGRLATQIAPILKGKHKPTFRPNADIGDYVVIVNAEKVCIYGVLSLFVVVGCVLCYHSLINVFLCIYI